MSNINFLKGEQIAFNAIESKDENSIYITEDTKRGMLGEDRLWATIQEVNQLKDELQALITELRTYVDASFVNKTGDTMTGQLIFEGVTGSAIEVSGSEISGVKALGGMLSNSKRVILDFANSDYLGLSQQDTSTWTGDDAIIRGVKYSSDANTAVPRSAALTSEGGTFNCQLTYTGGQGTAIELSGNGNISGIRTMIGKNTDNKQVIMEFANVGEVGFNVQDTSTWTGAPCIISGVAAPINDDHAVNKKYFEDNK